MSEIDKVGYTLLNTNEEGYSLDNLDNGNNSNMTIKMPEEVPKKKRERVYWIDCLRVFASILVVFHHTNFSQIAEVPNEDFNSFNFKVLYFYNTFTRPCVPFFIMISGVFFLNPERRVTIGSIYKKNLFRIFKGFVFWSIYYNVFDYLVINFTNFPFVYNKDLAVEVFKFCVLGLGHLWYLPFVFGLYAVTPIYREVARNTEVAIYTAILCVFLAQFIPFIVDFVQLFFNFDIGLIKSFFDYTLTYTALGYTNYFMMGYLFGCIDFKKKSYIYITYLVGIVGIVGTTIIKLMAANKVQQDNNYFGDYNSFNVSMSTVGIFCFFKYTIGPRLNKLMEIDILKSLLLTLSDCSYGVYLIHYTVYHIFIKFGINSVSLNPIFWLPIYTMIIYLISFVLIYAMRKVSILREIT
ncbi:hypothetical protein BCR32DRAFT_329719 [Anaeromyces robustus]|uniref:Acyltransferase 3 domain-containing protein n=1 Tax=Anaeromyces robustus TaxID=1754192 RepID=A0A1Y1WQ33_9FUNG|nr:hypothetical protein BCR32DRAFT_329719 [Anaeromyces robustus]|eukprot:ORX75649.1 hypothetical protein BCR32DRAFT_329719 [Anaeromyces robustus]